MFNKTVSHNKFNCLYNNFIAKQLWNKGKQKEKLQRGCWTNYSKPWYANLACQNSGIPHHTKLSWIYNDCRYMALLDKTCFTLCNEAKQILSFFLRKASLFLPINEVG